MIADLADGSCRPAGVQANRTVEEAQAFVARFPMLELADGTELPTHQSPYLPFAGAGAVAR